MLCSILVGLDGSEYSQAALEWALAQARGRDVLVVGQGVIDEPGIRAGTPTPLGADFVKEKLEAQQLHQSQRHVEQILASFALRCAEAGVSRKELQNTGDPRDQIFREAQRFDLVALGQKTFFAAINPDEPDDTLVRVLKHGGRPVVCVPPKPASGRGAFIAYDGSVQAARTLQLFALLRLVGDDPVFVVSVAAEHDEASRHAERAADFLRPQGFRVEVHVETTSAAVGDALVVKIQELQPALAVMGCFGQRTIREFFFGSVTSALLEQAPVPLFLGH